MPDGFESEALTPVREKLRSWFLTGLGQSLVQTESDYVSHVLPDLFGYHILQAGGLAGMNYLSSSRISHRIFLLIDPGEDRPDGSCLCSSCESFPVASDSMDVVVLPHLLEFASNPHQVLREVERTLIGEGHVVIIGFNPWSLWGLWRVMLRWWDTVPWCGRFFGIPRVKDWLALLDFEIVHVRRLFYRPPLQNPEVMEKLMFMEKLGLFFCRYMGGVYIIVAKKRVIPLTPVRMQWSARRRMIASGVAEPSARRVTR